MRVERPVTQRDIEGHLVVGDIFDVARHLPSAFVDLLILDPPYNLSRNFNGNPFRRRENDVYVSWFREVIDVLIPAMKPDATLYACADWRTSMLISPILEARFHIRNRITWEREKGRGARENWKNNMEDIWFCTRSNRYHFDVEAVKLKRRVLASYRTEGKPKGWEREEAGAYRLTHPSNIWTDVTVPFWSMPENTDHPTQKPEKLIAKLVLASSKKGDLVFDPFLGSGTTAVVAQKLGRRWCGVDADAEYLCWALKRIAAARRNPSIQGYDDGVFWERNTHADQRARTDSRSDQTDLLS